MISLRECVSHLQCTGGCRVSVCVCGDCNDSGHSIDRIGLHVSRRSESHAEKNAKTHVPLKFVAKCKVSIVDNGARICQHCAPLYWARTYVCCGHTLGSRRACQSGDREEGKGAHQRRCV